MNAATAPTSRPPCSAKRYTGCQPLRFRPVPPVEPESSRARKNPCRRNGLGPWSSPSHAAASTCEIDGTARTEIVLEATYNTYVPRPADQVQDRWPRRAGPRVSVHEGTPQLPAVRLPGARREAALREAA